MALGVVKACSTQPLPSVRVDEIQQGDLRPEGQIAGVTDSYPLPTSKCVWGALWGGCHDFPVLCGLQAAYSAASLWVNIAAREVPQSDRKGGCANSLGAEIT